MIMEENLSKRKSGFDAVVTIGFVGHAPVEVLAQIKEQVENLPCFHLIFFKTSSGKLWIMEGESNDD